MTHRRKPGCERWIPPTEIPDVPHVRHPTTILEWAGFSAEIDVEIAPLILLIWEQGIDTVSCCQNVEDRVHIEFWTPADLTRFLDAAVDHSSDVESIYNRAAIEHEPDDWEDFRVHRLWHYAAGSPIDLNPLGRRPRFELPVSVFFPRTDLAAVVSALGGSNG